MKAEALKPSVSVVIPVFNSEKTLAPLAEDLIGCMETAFRIEVILVNDASTDDSENSCLGLHEKYPSIVKVISLARNAGEYNAVMAGLRHAGGDYAVVMDDDGQNPPSEALVLMEALLSGDFDIVYGIPKRKKHSLWRNCFSAMHNAAACLLLGKPRGLYLSSFKAMNRFVLEAVCRDDSPRPFPDAVILRATKLVGQVLVDHEARKSGKSGYSFLKLLRLSFRMLPAQGFLTLKKPQPAFVIRKTTGFNKA